MDTLTRTHFENLAAADGSMRYDSLVTILEATNKPVDWAYEVWDGLVERLAYKDNHQRAIAAQVLSNLARSDPDNRIIRDFKALLAVTKDERFVTARHGLQAIWKVGLAGEPQRQMVVEALERRFDECRTEKNGSLVRYDIIEGLRKLYDETAVEEIRKRALALIESEEDEKYRKKYARLWKNA